MSDARWNAARAAGGAASSPLLVWNGLVTRVRRIGVERRETRLVSTPTARSEEEEPVPSARLRTAAREDGRS
jgi:hypothetical protein